MKREYIFKAKSSQNGEWKVGYLNHQLIAFEKFVPYICDFNGKYWEIDEDTISQRVFSCKTNEYQLVEIFENDIVEVEIHSGTKYKYLVWFSREMEATKLNYSEMQQYLYNIGKTAELERDAYERIEEFLKGE